MPFKTVSTWLLAPLATASFAQAVAEPQPPALQPVESAVQTIEVTGPREVDFFANYKDIYAGLQGLHAARPEFAPKAVVRFFVAPAEGSSDQVRVVIVGKSRELEVTAGKAVEFEFPMDDALALESARVLVTGGGLRPTLRVIVRTEEPTGSRWRLGDARLLCSFLTAARQSAATGINSLVYGIFGSYTCRVPVPVDPSTHQVVAIGKNGKEVPLSSSRGQIYFPVHLSSLGHDAVVEARPQVAAPTMP